MKTCSKCKIEKEVSEFTKNKTSKDGLFSQCRKCKNNRVDVNVIEERLKLGFKTCGTCKVERPLSDFGKQKSSKDGFRYRCRPCRKIYREKNKNEISQRRKIHREKNRDEINKRKREHRKNNPEYYKELYRRARSKEGYKERKAESDKKYYEKNKEKIKEYRKKYKKTRNQKRNERLKTDKLFWFKTNYRKRTLQAFKRRGYKKNSKTQEILGIEWSVAKKHIERQFKKGMTWDNQGEWHIDHIIPLASATSEEELKKLCHYTNLQPLWAEENIIKRDKIIETQITLRI